MNRIQSPNSQPRRLNAGIRRVVLAGLVAVSSAAALSAWAQPMPGMMGGGMGHDGGHGMAGSPEQSGRMIDHMLDGLGATDAQRTQIKQIMQAAANDTKAMRDAGRALHDKQIAIFTAPNVDAAAAESLRQQMLAQHDQMSKRMTQALLDASRVLTPEQRTKLGERLKQRQAQMTERMQRMDRERKQ